MEANRMRRFLLSLFLSLGVIHALAPLGSLRAEESIWLEAEHLKGIRGYCWPMGKPAMKKTAGHWGLSGPGWAAEWTQGGESGFLSIATGADDDKAVVTAQIEVPVDGRYYVWVRYGDWREQTERFGVMIEQAGNDIWSTQYGQRAIIEEDNEMKLYWGWAFAWDKRAVDLKKGKATLSLMSGIKESQPRQVDVIVLTTDESYRPRIKERPRSHTWAVLDSYRQRVPENLEPLARRAPSFDLPDAWKLRTFGDQGDKGFLYLWNVSHTNALETWLSDKPNRVKFPYNITDSDVRAEFEMKYGGKDEVPIFSDPRVVPTFHGVGAGVFATDPKTGEVQPLGQAFARWLDADPARKWAMMMNYHNGVPIGEKGVALLEKYRDRYIGSIAGESLGYIYPNPEEMRAATEKATTRRELAEAFTPMTLKLNADKYRKVYGRDIEENPYRDVIACLSVGNIAWVPLTFDWGARVGGYESSTMTSSILSMRWAFMRGAARQHSGLTATYRSCNFGDASTIFSNTQSYTKPQAILDNYYSVFSGAGMTWYKMDIWYQYMAGSSMFYHEQGFDEFWKPGGTAAAGIQEVQLSPKGKLVDRFLRVTAAEPERGTPYTPVAFLVDYAHGWEPSPFWPNTFKNWHQHQDRFTFGDHERMLEEYFFSAFHPIGPESEKPITGTNEVYVPGVFGDMFDVIFAYPDVNKWRTIDSYPVVIAAGDLELTEAEGKRLAKYVDDGGTLLVAAGQLTDAAAKTLKLPTGEMIESDGYRWLNDAAVHPSQRFRCHAIAPKDETWKTLATTREGVAICASVDRGKGRLIYLAVPRAMGIDRRAVPILPRLIAHLTRGLMPVEVEGEVEWMVNRTSTGWLVTLMNPAGQDKPQQGITPTDFRQNRSVVIHSHLKLTTARDRLLPTASIEVRENRVEIIVDAGAVRLIELR